MSYLKVPNRDDSRNSLELRRCVDGLQQQLALLQAVADKCGQIHLGGGGQAVEEEYDLAAAEEPSTGTAGNDLNTLLQSAASEARPFVAQLISRVG